MSPLFQQCPKMEEKEKKSKALSCSCKIEAQETIIRVMGITKSDMKFKDFNDY